MENRDFIKWEMEMGGMKSSGEISFEREKEKSKEGRDPRWAEICRKIGAALMNVAEKWEKEAAGSET